MEQAKKYNPAKSESLKAQFSRFASRMSHRWNQQPVTLDDINTIKLPSVSVPEYLYGDDYSFFASRNKGGKWNIEAQKNYGGEYLEIKSIATDLDLPAALDLLASKNPDSMKIDTQKFWHPVSVAKLIGHTIKTAEAAPANKNLPKPAGMVA